MSPSLLACAGAGGPNAAAEQYHDVVLATPGLVNFWRQTETSGTNAVSAGPGGHNGTYLNGPVLNQPSLLANDTDPSVDYDGVNDELFVAHTAALNLLADFSWEAIIRPDSLPGVGAFRSFIGKSNQHYMRIRNVGGTIRFEAVVRTATSSYVSCVGTSTPAINTTYHALMSRSSSDGFLRLYVNGTQENSVSCGSAFSTTNGVVVGSEGAGNYFDGRVQAPAYYNVAVPAVTVAAHYAAAGVI